MFMPFDNSVETVFGTQMSPVTQIATDRLEKLRNNVQFEAPACDCFPGSKFLTDNSPFYTHLGSAASLPALRKTLEDRLELKGEAIRIEKLLYTGKEGKTAQGCPIAKWVMRRSGPEEKVLFLVKHRDGHRCSSAWIVVVSVAWEGVRTDVADDLYESLVYKLTNFGVPTERRCGTNNKRTCACQGTDMYSGASFSFGCSWSVYYNGCKFARSKVARKFHLSAKSEEIEMEEMMQALATNLAPVYLNMAPDSYFNQIALEEVGRECRLGLEEGRPWSGVTACVDFCAHSHRDVHNMNNGCTVIVTLTKHRGFDKPQDEQLHVLPLYILSDSDEFGSKDGQTKQIQNGGLEILHEYPVDLRYRSNPLLSCRKRRQQNRKNCRQNSPNNNNNNPNDPPTLFNACKPNVNNDYYQFAPNLFTPIPRPHIPPQTSVHRNRFDRNRSTKANPLLLYLPRLRRALDVASGGPGDEDEFYEIHSDNEDCFVDKAVGGVAIALGHGSVLFECAKQELHASTALREPNRLQPARIALVFYQHKNMNFRNHGEREFWEKRNARDFLRFLESLGLRTDTVLSIGERM